MRTQVQFTEEQYRRIRVLAQRRGVSISQVVRESVERHLEAETYDTDALYARVAEVVGKYDDREGREDLSSDHDELLDGAYR